jgi:hypothetical protein
MGKQSLGAERESGWCGSYTVGKQSLIAERAVS